MLLAANLNSLWRELPYLDRFFAAAAAGFRGVAVPLPYDSPAKDTQRAALGSALTLVQISAPPPNYTGGARGFAAIPGLEGRFRHDLTRALRYCEALRVPVLHVMAGLAEGPEARAALISNLRFACENLTDGVTLTLQPQAQQGAFLNDYALTADIIAEVGSDRLGLQFHSEHAQALHGDAVRMFETYADIIRHVQLGDAPGGGVPGSGTVDFDGLFALLESRYNGWVVADYRAEGATEESLGWLPALAA